MLIQFLPVILAVFALGILVFVHEWGHYWVARRCKMRVECFSIGFGKPILAWDRKGVRWQIGWMPFGGYVKIAGMQVEGGKIPADGFFGKKPIDRLKVAIAGPLVNLLVGFVLFGLIWACGGRIKDYDEVSNRVGFVDAKSHLAVAPGDIIETVNGQPYDTFINLMKATLTSSDCVQLTGQHIQENGRLAPFSFCAVPYEMKGSQLKTTGILAPASFLIYRGGMLPGVPMEGSGIQEGDRLVWADGETIYSQEQLSFLINEQKALLTILRGGQRMVVRVPRVTAGQMGFSPSAVDDLMDQQYTSGLRGRWTSLMTIPYELTDTGVVDRAIGMDLQRGDRIIAVDGVAVATSADILRALQVHRVAIIVQRGVQYREDLSAAEANSYFDSLLDRSDIEKMVAQVGGHSTPVGNLVLLTPVEAKPQAEFAVSPEWRAEFQRSVAEMRRRLEAESDSEKRAQLLPLFDEEVARLKLGIPLTDLPVRYNPTPQQLFVGAFTEVGQTLRSLATGTISPKALSGPIGIVNVIQNNSSRGILEAVYWVAFISINLGLLNLLPLPVLDGGYILLSLYEMISGQKVSPKLFERIVFPFVILLIGFFLFVTYWDLRRIF